MGLPQPDLSELYRRALFNILARNQDDHTKNIAFLMDRCGGWRPAPAYDLIYAYNPTGAWTHRHQMTLAGKRDDLTTQDLLTAARAADLRPAHAKSVLQTVTKAILQWQDFAEIAGIPGPWILEIQGNLRRSL